MVYSLSESYIFIAHTHHNLDKTRQPPHTSMLKRGENRDCHGEVEHTEGPAGEGETVTGDQGVHGEEGE